MGRRVHHYSGGLRASGKNLGLGSHGPRRKTNGPVFTIIRAALGRRSDGTSGNCGPDVRGFPAGGLSESGNIRGARDLVGIARSWVLLRHRSDGNGRWNCRRSSVATTSSRVTSVRSNFFRYFGRLLALDRAGG